MTVQLRIVAALAAGSVLAGCDYTGDWVISQPVPGLPAVYEITNPDGTPLVPAVLGSLEDVEEATIYGEVGGSETAELGGVTAEFIGTGGPVCIWVDPETLSWTQAVAESPSGVSASFSYPDNVWDDGDLDLRVGQSVFYTGSPDRIGDFEVSYEDDLGNAVDVELQDCPNQEDASLFADFVDAGRGAPERCTIRRTEPGVSYTVVLRTWSTPIDDERLSFGLLVASGPCNGSGSVEEVTGRTGQTQGGDDNVANAECVIRSESLRPHDLGDDASLYEPYFGLSAIEDLTYPNMLEIEDVFCRQADLTEFCRAEAQSVRQDNQACVWEGFEDDQSGDTREQVRCFCGDPSDTPQNGPG